MSKKDDALAVIADAEQALIALSNQGHGSSHSSVREQYDRINQAIKDGGGEEDLKDRGRKASHVIPAKHSVEFPQHKPE